MAALGCYTLRGRCVCVFGVKCGDLCGGVVQLSKGQTGIVMLLENEMSQCYVYQKT